MKDRDLQTDERQEVAPVDVAELGRVLLNRQVGRQPGVDADQDRRTQRAKADGCALDDHPGHDCRQPRKTQTNEERDRHRGGCPEAGRTFDERTEQPGDDDDLHPAVGRDVGEPLTDGPERAALLQRIQQQDRPKDDVQERERHDQPVD